MSDLPKLRFSGSLHIEVEMDLAEHFSKLSTAFHNNYWAMNLADWGYEEEYERPLAWVMSWLDQDMENADIGRATPGGTNRPSEIEWDNVYIAGSQRLEAGRFWTEEHFERLISLVPWLVPPPDKGEISREDYFRIPSDTDVALPGLTLA